MEVQGGEIMRYAVPVLGLIVAVALIVGCGGGETTTPTLAENTDKLAAALTLEPDGEHRSYEDTEGTFQIRYFPDSATLDFEVWILRTPVKENALKALEFIHQSGISDHCNPRLRISWNPSEALVREGKAGPEDFLSVFCAED